MLKIEDLFRDYLVAILPRDHPLKRKRTLGWSDIQGYPQIAVNSRSQLRQTLNAQSAQHGVRCSAVDFRQHVDQKFRLGGIVRRIAVDFEEAGQAVNQVINRRSKVRAGVAASPLIQTQTIAFVFFQRGGVEHAQHIVVDAYGFDFVYSLACGAPVKRVHILQYGKYFDAGHLVAQRLRQVPWGEINRIQRISPAINPPYSDNAPSLPVPLRQVKQAPGRAGLPAPCVD